MIRHLCLVVAITGLIQHAFSQTSNYIHYGIEDGLPQSQVRAIEQDSLGNLWIGTMAGITAFDGFAFTDLNTENGLNANRVNCIFQGSELYIGSTGTVNYLKGETLKKIHLGDGYEEVRVLDIAEAKNGDLFFATAGKGVVRWNGQNLNYYGILEGLPDLYVRSLAFDKKGRLWIGTRNGLLLMDIENSRILLPHLDVPLISVSQIRLTSDGSMLVGTFGNGAFLFNEREFVNLTEDDGLISNSIRCVIELAEGDYWFGSRWGISRYHWGKLESFDENNGLPYANIKSIGKDIEGNLWLGTDGKGLLRRTGDLFQNFTTEHGLSSNLIMGMHKQRNGSILMATYDAGISILDSANAEGYAYNDQLPSSTVWTVGDRNGAVVAGTSAGFFAEENGQITTITNRDGLPGNRVTSMLVTESSEIIIGADSGLAWLDLDFKIKNTITNVNGKPLTGVRCILRHPSGIYCGTNLGLLDIDSKGNKSIHVLPNRSKIYSLAIDDSAHVWVGSGDGLFHFDIKTRTFTSVMFSKSFGAKNINFLDVDETGKLFIGTNDGLFNIDIRSYYLNDYLSVIQYTKYEGLSSSETNQGAAFHDGAYLWFGTISGAVKFNADFATTANHHPILSISDVDLFLDERKEDELLDLVDSQNLPSNLELAHHQNYLTFNYRGAYFKNPEKVRYQYLLEGVDNDWLPPTKNRSATYSYLPDGKFTFRVKSFQIDDPSNYSEAKFDFTILPPFYKTLWFYFIVVILLGGILYLIYSSRIKKEKVKRERLQLQLQSKLIELESQSLNSSMNRHFIFNALNSIQYYINTQDRKSANKYLTSFAKLIRKNLDSSQQMDTSLGEEIERLKLYLSLEQMRFDQRFDYEFLIDKGVDVDTLTIPAMMLQPFLENSIWHGILPSNKRGRIKIKVEPRGESYDIIIDDNGIGIDTSLNNKSNKTEAHVSQGMSITVNRVRLYQNMTGLNYEVNGPFERKNNEGHSIGTRVVVRIPKKTDR